MPGITDHLGQMFAEQRFTEIIEAQIPDIGKQLIDDLGESSHAHRTLGDRHSLSGRAQRASQIAKVAGFYNHMMGIARNPAGSEEVIVFVSTPVRQLRPAEISVTFTQFVE
jgi:hypothetical protein